MLPGSLSGVTLALLRAENMVDTIEQNIHEMQRKRGQIEATVQHELHQAGAPKSSHHSNGNGSMPSNGNGSTPDKPASAIKTFNA